MVGRCPHFVLTPPRLYTSLPAFRCWRRLHVPARPSRSTRPSRSMAVCYCAPTNRFVYQPSTLLWGPTRTRCTQYDPRTATIFTRLEHFSRTTNELSLGPRRYAGDWGRVYAPRAGCYPRPSVSRALRWLFSSLHPCLVCSPVVVINRTLKEYR